MPKEVASKKSGNGKDKKKSKSKSGKADGKSDGAKKSPKPKESTKSSSASVKKKVKYDRLIIFDRSREPSSTSYSPILEVR